MRFLNKKNIWRKDQIKLATKKKSHAELNLETCFYLRQTVTITILMKKTVRYFFKGL